jgi:hypothetical protein
MSDTDHFAEAQAAVQAFIRGDPLTEEQVRRARRDYWREQPVSHRVQVFIIRCVQRLKHYCPGWVLWGLVGIILALIFT